MAQVVLALVLIVAGLLLLIRGFRTLSRSRPRANSEPSDESGEPGRYLALAGVAVIAVGVLALLT